MPSRPPETKIYEAADATTLWRDLTRLYEDFCGEDSDRWEEQRKRFVVVAQDLLTHIRDSCHEACRRMPDSQGTNLATPPPGGEIDMAKGKISISKSGQKQSGKGKGSGKVVTTDVQGGGAPPAGGTGAQPNAQGKGRAGSTKKVA